MCTTCMPVLTEVRRMYPFLWNWSYSYKLPCGALGTESSSSPRTTHAFTEPSLCFWPLSPSKLPPNPALKLSRAGLAIIIQVDQRWGKSAFRAHTFLLGVPPKKWLLLEMKAIFLFTSEHYEKSGSIAQPGVMSLACLDDVKVYIMTLMKKFHRCESVSQARFPTVPGILKVLQICVLCSNNLAKKLWPKRTFLHGYNVMYLCCSH